VEGNDSENNNTTLLYFSSTTLKSKISVYNKSKTVIPTCLRNRRKIGNIQVPTMMILYLSMVHHAEKLP
jgi:hypothetical protein